MRIQDWETIDGRTISIHNAVDIIALRMEVRQFARKVGLNLISQSSISLVTSDLAYKIGLGSRAAGNVEMLWKRNNYKTGVQLIITTPVGPNQEFPQSLFNDLDEMVDEMSMDLTPGFQMTISMAKWTDSNQNNSELHPSQE
jgi:hypothetical protein